MAGRSHSRGDNPILRASQRMAMLAALDYQEILYVVVKGAKVRPDLACLFRPTEFLCKCVSRSAHPLSRLIQEGGSSASLAARLLQALRWRLVRSNAGNDRWEVLATWIQVDLLGVYQYDGQTTQELLKVRACRQASDHQWHDKLMSTAVF